MIFLTSNSCFPLLISHARLFSPFLKSFPRDGVCSAAVSLLQKSSYCLEEFNSFSGPFSLLFSGLPCFHRVVLFEVKHTCGGFFGFCCSCGGTELKYITVTVTEQRFHCEIPNQILHITQDTNKLSLSGVWLCRKLISGPLSALLLRQLRHRCMALSEDLHVGLSEMGLTELNCCFL